MKKRSKRRTHVPQKDSADIPKGLVLKSGVVGKDVARLVFDLRRVLEPNTAMKLRERKSNKLRDFVHIASQFSISHLLLLTKTNNSVNLRIGRLPRGPTVTFRVLEYSLTKDVLSIQNRPKSPGAAFRTSPLLVLNNFSSNQPHLKLTSTILQSLFPSIDVQKMKLADARRVVLFNYISETGEIEFRHYAITVKSVGVSKSVKNLIGGSGYNDVVNLGGFEDVADYILRGAIVSESDVEDADESTVDISQKYVGRGNQAVANGESQRAVRLVELGPRMRMKIMKIQTGLCEGEVVYHENVRNGGRNEAEESSDEEEEVEEMDESE
ncbi:hypothetical protein HK098_007809 [Nowakowskiella sp. JEL0407]|nr:hypothetical protein HK098_007809 [Nowakowskiella sp. JEL0407]